ncbi:GntR family transcriptional regulator [Bradyrhizobium sp. WD16]|uniref:GntR family transcriptional regulator n=1 Tax=Bradyrhizobium sp. WD16 TaxID=1521768 RepID=UPI0020A4CD1F|nr:GntR family transcriptional regulator [Bradyrhizobium sp. WD16]UTD26884.1 GntR family transcriptional regulator [Bradyrhizobium sp. WD16]
MKANTVYKRAYNDCLALLAARPLGEWPASEAELSERLQVSRTTVRAVLATLIERTIVKKDGPRRLLCRHPGEDDYFPDTQTETVARLVERKFMQWVLRGDCRPGQTVNTSELARQFGASTTAVREFLTRFSRFGLIKRRENSGWIFAGVTAEFASEIYEVREIFELRSARSFIELPDHAPAWAQLDALEREHHRLLRELDERYSDFSGLDERLHRLIHDALSNRFIREFDDVISFIFHYHYQWDKSDEKERNRVALSEHLKYIAALRSRDPQLVESACRAHLHTARATLLRSIDLAPHREMQAPGAANGAMA